MSQLEDKLKGAKVREKPASISLKKPRRKKKILLPPEPVKEFNKDAPEHKSRIIRQVVKDKALEARVTLLEKAGDKEIVVTLPDPAPRARIERIAIEYDGLGHPKALVPTYGE